MSNYNDNSWSDKFSWIITVIAMVLVAILSIGLLCALFIQPQEEKKEEETLIIAQVNDYVNIRNTPGTDGEIVGKLYDDSVGTLIEEAADGWYRVKSGSVEGYVKAEYFKTGDEAKRIADEVGNKIAVVNTQTLKVRTDASLDASVLGLIPMGEELTVLEEKNAGTVEGI